MEFNLTPDSLVVLLGATISLLFSYFPKLNTWFASLEDDIKSIIMITLMIVMEAVVYLLSCVIGVIHSNIACLSGFWNIVFNLAVTLVLAIMSNQSIYSITKKLKTNAVKRVDLEKLRQVY